MTMDKHREHLLKLFEQKEDLDLKKASLLLGKSHSYLHQYIHKGTPKKLDGDDRKKLSLLLAVDERELVPEGESIENLKTVAVYDNSDNEFVKIPVYDVQASAGNGTYVDNERILYHLSFRKDWIKNICKAPITSLCVIRVCGDSMMPTLSHDDTVLVDMTQTRASSDGIYVIVYDDLLMVKRVRVDPVRNIATIISDNTIYSPIENISPEDIRIAGKVIWCGRRV